MLSGAAVGAVVSVVAPCDAYVLMAIGAFFGILPDFDLMLAPLYRGAHRSVGSHSLMASAAAAACWATLLVFVAPAMDHSLTADRDTALSTTTVVFLSMFAHAAEDSLSVGGCRLFYPFSRRRFRGPVRYDDVVANSILIVVAVVVILASSGLVR